MKKILAILTVIILASGLSFAEGEGYISSVTASASVSTATTGTNFQITSVLTAGSSETTANQIQLISTGSNNGGSFTVNDPSIGYYSNTAVSTSGTTKTFTATAGIADTYTYYITATYSGGSKSSTSQVIEFINPAALTISGTPSSAGSKSSGQSYTLSISIQNPTSSNVVTAYSLSCPSGTTCTGDPTSSTGTTITAGTSKSLQWTVTIDSDFSGTKNVVFTLGDNTDAFTSSISGTATTTTTASSPGGDSSGGGTTITSGAAAIAEQITLIFGTNGKLTANIEAKYDIDKTMSVSYISFTSNEDLLNPKINIAKLVSRPENTPAPSIGSVHEYIEITPTNIQNSQISKAILKFKVPISKVSDTSKVALYRYHDSIWQKLTTRYTNTMGDDAIFESDVPGFSTFAVVIESAVETTTSTTLSVADATTTTTTIASKLPTILPVSGETDITNIYILLIILIVVGVSGFLYYEYTIKKHPSEKIIEKKIKEIKKKVGKK
ncbi:MAG: PGF-pre-PGF domain-containing protein [Candidatus Aenigmarchaeota archaeon]|nr:PGF-pre-PGF domain-containing protein [Candidatus Aenigmarchaeota archaeon]